MTAAVAASSQNAWMEMRGIGRALACPRAGGHEVATLLPLLLGDGKRLLAHGAL
jgi:hypothetical protein